jgi:tyrosyl-DNA phosphodiesterase 2
MAAALVYLKTLHARARSDGLPLVIMLQEMIESDLQQIQSASWIRDSFLITDRSTEYWESPMYGTTTLIEKRVLDRQSSQERGKKEGQGAQDVFRVHYGNTRM